MRQEPEGAKAPTIPIHTYTLPTRDIGDTLSRTAFTMITVDAGDWQTNRQGWITINGKIVPLMSIKSENEPQAPFGRLTITVPWFRADIHEGAL